jgi:diaminopimelate dehydrogenase
MKRLRLAIIGFGRLGRACAQEMEGAADLDLAGVVCAPDERPSPLPGLPEATPRVDHISELVRVDAALVCVPAERVGGVAHDLLQHRVPLVDCAALEGQARQPLWEGIDRVARQHRVAAMVGAGWSAGAVSWLEHLFTLMVPKGETVITNRPGINLHHTAAAADIPGVQGALCTEIHDSAGRPQRYLYLQLERGADFDSVREAVRADPMFRGEETLVFQVEDIAELEDEAHGIVMERRGTAGRTVHDTLLFEARFDPAAFTARIMLDAARRLPGLPPGAHRWTP